MRTVFISILVIFSSLSAYPQYWENVNDFGGADPRTVHWVRNQPYTPIYTTSGLRYFKIYTDTVFVFSLMNRNDSPHRLVGIDSVTGALRSFIPAYLTSEIDGDIANELQVLGGSGRTVTLSLGGGSYTFPLTEYDSLLNRPVIPDNTNQLINGAGFITASSPSLLTNKSGNISMWTNDSGYLTSVPAQSFASLTGKPATLSGYGITDAVPASRSITINGSAKDLSADRSWTLTTTEISEGSALYFTTARARTAISLTTAGSSGAATYNPSTGVLNIPAYGGASVTSVGLTSSDLNISGSPITSSGYMTANLTATGVSAGTYGTLTVDTKGRATAGKRQETYSGTTNASGIYSVTFSSAYLAAPNIQANIVGGTPNQTITMTVTATGFTCTVVQRSAVTLLGIEVLLAATTPVNGASVDVLINEK